MGMKIAGWAFEIARDRARLAAAVDDAATGKISGPVGTYSHLDPDLEDEVLADLGLHRDPISTQIVQRDRHAALVAAIAITGGSLERIATEVRNLQHTEIGELMEPFRAGQKGSSAMPHKRNPILCERIAGHGPPAARLRRRGHGEPAALARARHQPLLGRAGAAARRHDPARLHAREDARPGRAAGRPAGADAREHRARPGAPLQQPRPAGPGRGGRACRARRRTPSSSATRCGPPTSAASCATCWPPIPDVAARLSDEALAACFDESHFLRNVATAMARLDELVPAGKEAANVAR